MSQAVYRAYHYIPLIQLHTRHCPAACYSLAPSSHPPHAYLTIHSRHFYPSLKNISHLLTQHHRQTVRASTQQPRLYVGMVLILIFAEVLGLYGVIVSILMLTRSKMGVTECPY